MQSVDAKAEKQTLVEEGTQFKGSLSSNCPIVVRGRVEGEIAAPSLVVSDTGAVHGKVKVAEIRSQGELSGELDADVVQLSGVVRDNTIVRAKSLSVQLMSPGGKMQVVFGECTLDVGELPSKEAALNPPQVAAVQAVGSGVAASTSADAAAEEQGASGNGVAPRSQPPGAKGEPRKSNRPQNGTTRGSSPPQEGSSDDEGLGDGGRRVKTGGAAKA